MSSAEALTRVAELVTAKEFGLAAAELAAAFPPLPPPVVRRRWPLARLVRLFVRDAFTDRYFGEPLVFPGALRLLSVLLPDAFPYHPNWKQALTHPAYWTHYATIDHVIPLARGGEDAESNIVTTSMLHNAAKANWLVSELRWPAALAPAAPDWDGLLPWFCREYEANATLRSVRALRQWYEAARRAA